ncbi:hypothetical protein M408DRAFT_104932 [Serendipita vermifera MAFF 305830]|uniref:RRM domain-containing protein n=1 Tax=Serendipita vermifera MAFF 305830 TaxID=933852 RepID=A0A0C2W4F0_SERVB|nr:hypothetical protein M408DRAFT_104932 [Serendipita vermifera MAFF 305830]
MGRVKQTEKAGSKEKKEKSGTKRDARDVKKTAKAKEAPQEANLQQDEPNLKASSKRSSKTLAADVSETQVSTEPNNSITASTTTEKKGKKSAAKSKESVPNPAKGDEPLPQSSNRASKKRAREEPETANQGSKSNVKKKKVESKPVLEAPAISSDASDASEDDVAQDGEGDEEVYLHGFTTDEDSSEDDDVMDQDPLEVKSLPNKAKDDADVKRRLDAAKRKPTADRGVLYIGRIPHGFYEEQMKDYFSQFGNVTRLRLARNKKTGRSKHYGFIEFDSSSVAKIVSETMDNYLLAGHLLQCKLVATEQLHPELWVGANRKWKRIPRGRVARLKHNKARTVTQQTRAEERLLKRQAEKEAKLKAAGISYSLSKVGYTRISA